MSSAAGWKRCTIGSLCQLLNGRAFKPTDWSQTGLPIVRIQNLNNPNAPLNHYQGEVRPRFLINSGSLLFAWSGTPGTSFGAHIWNGGAAVLNQHIFHVVFDEQSIDKQFFRLAINQKLDELIEKAHGGVGLRHVTKGKFESTEIDLPPLKEQKRIVAKLHDLLSRTESARGELDRFPKLVERYKQAILAAAFRGELTGSTWAEVSLRDVASVGTGSTPKRGSARFYEGGTVPWVTSGAVNVEVIETCEEHITQLALDETNCKVFPAGSLVVAMYGEGQTRGKVATLGIAAATNQALAALQVDSTKMLPEFLLWYLRFNYLSLRSQAAGGVQPNLNLGIIKDLRIPLPVIADQERVVATIRVAMEKVNRAQNDLIRAGDLLDRLNTATLAKAFRGQLTAIAEGRLTAQSLQKQSPRQVSI